MVKGVVSLSLRKKNFMSEGQLSERNKVCLLFVCMYVGLISIGFIMEEDGVALMVTKLGFLMEENGPTFMVELHRKERGKFMFWGFKRS
jgi:hypothetical protein